MTETLNLETFHQMGEGFEGNYPDTVKVWISDTFLSRIRTLSEIVEAQEAWTIQLFDYTPDCYKKVYDDEGGEYFHLYEGRIESSVLVVADDEFWWEMQIKGSGVRFATGTISIDGRAKFAAYNVGDPVPAETTDEEP